MQWFNGNLSFISGILRTQDLFTLFLQFIFVFVYVLLHTINSFLKFDIYMPIMGPWLKNKILVYLFMEQLHSDRIVVLHLPLPTFNQPLWPHEVYEFDSPVSMYAITLCYLTTRSPSVSIHSRYICCPSKLTTPPN